MHGILFENYEDASEALRQLLTQDNALSAQNNVKCDVEGGK
jgi:hypothetical protein